MPEPPMIGARYPLESQQVAEVSGPKPSDVVPEAIAEYLVGRTDLGSVKSAIASLEERSRYCRA